MSGWAYLLTPLFSENNIKAPTVSFLIQLVMCYICYLPYSRALKQHGVLIVIQTCFHAGSLSDMAPISWDGGALSK